MPPAHVILKILTATGCAALALLTPLAWVQPDGALYVVKHYGYWLILGSLLIYTVCAARALSTHRPNKPIPVLRKHWGGILCALFGTIFILNQTEPGFVILFDEHVLSSTGMNLHLNQMAYANSVTHYYADEQVVGLGFVDKRPLLLPALLSLMHGLLGYDWANIFLLNALLSFCLLLLLYGFLASACSRASGILGVLLLSGLPLFIQNASGGGYEILNLCLILALALSGLSYLRDEKGTSALDLMVMSAVLLANVRYESILYVLVPAFLFLWKSIHTRKIELSWPSVFSPLFLVLPLLSYSLFQAEPRFIQTSTENFFSLSHLQENITGALTYLLSWDGTHTNSFVLSGFGIISFIVLGIHVFRSRSTGILKSKSFIVFSALLVPVLANTLLVLTCYWGNWTDPATSRFSLPLQLMMVVAIPLATQGLSSKRLVQTILIVAATGYLVLFTPISSARMQHPDKLPTAAGYSWAMDWNEANNHDKNVLIIARSPIAFGLQETGSIPMRLANFAPEKVMQTLSNHIYEDIFVLEMLYRNESGIWETPPNIEPLDPAYLRDTVTNYRINDTLSFRISRISGHQKFSPTANSRAPDSNQAMVTLEELTRILPIAPPVTKRVDDY